MDPSLFLEHLSDNDLAVLARLAGYPSIDDLLARLRSDPSALDTILSAPSLVAALSGPDERDWLVHSSPFLVFSAFVWRLAVDLDDTPFVNEWIGPGRRVPMFEVGGLREFLRPPTNRLFLAQLLASYTHVSSGSVWTRTARGWRRRRFSDLDPMRLLELVEAVRESERPPLYRRLGDATLFLTGVFPDYAGRRFLPPIAWQRLRRAVPGADQPGLVGPESASEPVWLLEELGRRSYRMASQAPTDLLAGVAESFRDARRTLNILTDRYLFPVRDEWFPVGGD